MIDNPNRCQSNSVWKLYTKTTQNKIMTVLQNYKTIIFLITNRIQQRTWRHNTIFDRNFGVFDNIFQHFSFFLSYKCDWPRKLEKYEKYLIIPTAKARSNSEILKVLWIVFKVSKKLWYIISGFWFSVICRSFFFK